MADEFTFGIYVISYNRYGRGPITQEKFENVTHVVRKSQAELYEKAGFKNVKGVEDSLINGYDRVFNWVVDNAKEDVIAICDDDMKMVGYRQSTIEEIEDVETIQAEFERIAQIVYDLEIGVAYTTPKANIYDYTSEFKFIGIPGAFKIVNRAKVKARMDETLPYQSDIDFVLQELLENRICLSARYLCTMPYIDKDTMSSGTAVNASNLKAAVEIMSARWGNCYGYNEKKNVPRIKVKR